LSDVERIPLPQIGIDEEGGYPLIISDTIEKATLLKSLGININLAPVCDVSTNQTDYIYARAFGKNAAEMAKYVKIVVETMNANKIECTLKHFPQRYTKS